MVSNVFERVFFGTVIRLEFQNELSWRLDNVIGGNVLISVSVSSNNDWLSPAWHQSWDVLADDGFSEDSTVENISDCTVRGFPHLLQLEFFDSLLIRGDGGALDTNFVFLDCVGGIDGDLIVSLVSVFDSEIVIFNIDIEVRKDVLM